MFNVNNITRSQPNVIDRRPFDLADTALNTDPLRLPRQMAEDIHLIGNLCCRVACQRQSVQQMQILINGELNFPRLPDKSGNVYGLGIPLLHVHHTTISDVVSV